MAGGPAGIGVLGRTAWGASVGVPGADAGGGESGAPEARCITSGRCEAPVASVGVTAGAAGDGTNVGWIHIVAPDGGGVTARAVASSRASAAVAGCAGGAIGDAKGAEMGEGATGRVAGVMMGEAATGADGAGAGVAPGAAGERGARWGGSGGGRFDSGSSVALLGVPICSCSNGAAVTWS